MSGVVHAPESQERRPQALGLPPTPSGSTELCAGEKTSKTRLGAGRGLFLLSLLFPLAVVFPLLDFKFDLSSKICVCSGKGCLVSFEQSLAF